MGRVSRIANRNGQSPRPLTTYQSTVRSLSDRLVDAQRRLRILDIVKWDDDIERAFFQDHCRELPRITRTYYLSRPLPFDPDQKLTELHELERDLRQQLGDTEPLGQMMIRRCQEHRQVVHLLQARGTPQFADLSRQLYGRSQKEDLQLADLGKWMTQLLAHPSTTTAANLEPTMEAGQVVALLTARLQTYFRGSSGVRVQLSDGIVADAAAGCNYIKIRDDARFTLQQVRLLEVHEGWVHLGTTLNGQQQPICTFLSKGPPSSTATQEGLAVLTELLTLASYPRRIRRLLNRIEAVTMVEKGANFLEVFRYFLAEAHEPRESYQQTMRIFRGSLPEGCGPFTKDLCYARGFGMLCDFIRQGMVRWLPLLFCGKTKLADIPTLAELQAEGLIVPPRFLPPPFGDLSALRERLAPPSTGSIDIVCEG